MGGKGSGGRRTGAGRPKRTNVLAFAGGQKGPSSGSGAQTVAPGVAVSVNPPVALLASEDAVWSELAPRAVAVGTLTPTTVWSFLDLVRARVNRDVCRERMQEDGWVVKNGRGEPVKHPLEPALRGWEQRTEVGMARFALAPIGRAVATPPKEEDPFAEFEARG